MKARNDLRADVQVQALRAVDGVLSYAVSGLRGDAVTGLPLVGGFDMGPLFQVQLKRPPVRQPGKEGMVHRAQTVRATPDWADMQAIKAMYKDARRLTRETGELHVVDHIVPKMGKTVCGLHVPANLRVIHWLENAQKGAAWWPDMWGEQIPLL